MLMNRKIQKTGLRMIVQHWNSGETLIKPNMKVLSNFSDRAGTRTALTGKQDFTTVPQYWNALANRKSYSYGIGRCPLIAPKVLFSPSFLFSCTRPMRVRAYICWVLPLVCCAYLYIYILDTEKTFHFE